LTSRDIIEVSRLIADLVLGPGVGVLSGEVGLNPGVAVCNGISGFGTGKSNLSLSSQERGLSIVSNISAIVRVRQ